MKLPEFIGRDAEGYIHLAGHRIGLHSIVALYNEGYTPEMLAGEFPTLPLSLIHKVLGFYLENQVEVDGYVLREQRANELLRTTTPPGPNLEELRRRMLQLKVS